MKNYVIMMINAFVLIIIGVYGYFISGSPTSLISVVIGLILFICAFPVKKEKHVVTHIAVALTMLTSLAFFIVGFIRGNALILIMAVVSLIATILYVMDFLRRKKEREAAKKTSEV